VTNWRVLQQIHHIVHEVVFVGIRLIVKRHIKGLLEDRHYVGSVSRGYKIELASNFFDKFVFPRGRLFVHVYFIGDRHTGDVGALVAHFFVPVLQVLVGDLTI
jgi:hypothetical protein